MSRDAQKLGLFQHAPNTVVYPPHTTVFREGEEGHVMYAIKRGRLEVRVHGRVIDTLGEDEVFGEMALLEGTTRSATVVTLEETELVEITAAQFYILVRQNPDFALQLMRRRCQLKHADLIWRPQRGASALGAVRS